MLFNCEVLPRYAFGFCFRLGTEAFRFGVALYQHLGQQVADYVVEERPHTSTECWGIGERLSMLTGNWECRRMSTKTAAITQLTVYIVEESLTTPIGRWELYSTLTRSAVVHEQIVEERLSMLAGRWER